MKKVTTVLDRFVILCRNVQKASSIYSETLGLKVVLQSPTLVQLKDSNNMRIFLKQTNKPFELSKGYSPIFSFKVQDFDEVVKKMKRWELLQDGEIIETPYGKIANFLGSEGEHISINNLTEEEQPLEDKADEDEDKSKQEIKNLLSKIKF